MYLWTLVALLVVPLVEAQNSSQSAQVTVITSLSTSVGLASDRQPTTAIQTILITSTLPQQQQSNNTASGSNNPSGSSSLPSMSTTANLPTGTVAQVTGLAPSPGATGGSYGPDDDYINSATTPHRNVLLGAVLALGVGMLAL